MMGVIADIGGTHARFALASRNAQGEITLREARTLKTASYPSLEEAYRDFISSVSYTPRDGVFAVASPIVNDEIKLTNSHWSITPSKLAERLNLASVRVVNDFAAIAHATTKLPASSFRDLSRLPFKFPEHGAVSIVGPGSGLGVSLLFRADGRDYVHACEGGHIGFAPSDEVEGFILKYVSQRYPRVSTERLVSGPGLQLVYDALAALEQRSDDRQSPVVLWERAISGEDPRAVAAVERWLMLLGAFTGDVALTHGASAVILAGGILPRFGAALNTEPLLKRFYAKGRFEGLMRTIPVTLITHPEPGLIGAASLIGAERTAQPATANA